MVDKKHYHKIPIDNYSDFRDAAEITHRVIAAIDEIDGIQEKDIEGNVTLDVSISD